MLAIFDWKLWDPATRARLLTMRAVVFTLFSIMQLHFRSYGLGPPLIILHGLFGSLENWHSISQKLAADFQVFAVDQRNHGRSPHAAEMDYQLMAEDLKELVTRHQLS